MSIDTAPETEYTPGAAAALRRPATHLGSIYLPANPGTPVGEFRFIVDRDQGVDVVIGTPVAADTAEGTIIGTVTDLTTIGSDKDPLQADFEKSNSEFAPVAQRTDVLVATVQTFYSEKMRPVRSGTVRPATAEEMLKASGADRIEWKIPAGVVPLADGDYAKICFDGHTLIGPEAAHLNVGGLSGQASKTSYAGVLLRSAIHSGSPEESVGAIIFNVKGQDLVNLDEPPAAGYELTDTDHAIYAAMGIPATPFADVTVYAPALPGSNLTRSSKETAEPLRWDLKLVWPYLRFFFPSLFDNDNMMAFFGDFEAMKLRTENSAERIDTFDKFERWIDSEIAEVEDDGTRQTGWRSHHVATMRRARKQIMSLPERCGGLLIKGKARDVDDVPVRGWRHGQVVVVDIAGLETIVQAAVIARTCSRLLDSAEHGELGLDHLVLFADELNMFAPATGGELAPVRNILRKISATGRYAGMSLWGAAQFLSQVDAQILGNAATRATGILSESELDSGVYGRMPAGQKERILTLPKGQMALKAYNLRGQLVVAFPRPAWKTGKAKVAAGVEGGRKTAADALGLSRGSVQRLTEGLAPEAVERVVARADDPDAAVAALEKLREPDMAKVSVESSSTYDPDNPFDLEID